MNHPDFYKRLGPFTLNQIALFLKAELQSEDDSFLIYDFNSIEKSKISDICFLNDNYVFQKENKTEAKTFIVSKNNKFSFEKNKNILRVNNLHLAVAQLSNFFYTFHDIDYINSLNPPIFKGSSNYLDKTAVISNGVIIGDNANIMSGVHVGHNCIIGKNVTIENNSIISNSIIGDNVTIGRNCSIGQAGFGFAINIKENKNIFHKGRVILQDNVQIGSNCCIDRGSMNDTVIGENTYFDNLCHVAHNVVIGSNCIFAACTGIAGSSKIGDFVLTGGQVGIAGHIKIGNKVQIAAKSGVFNDINDGEKIMGSPAINKFKYIKNYKKNYGK